LLCVLLQVELMLLSDSWRMGWQLWAQPAQNPGVVATWPQVGALKGKGK
jgi:hypothetical protein